MFRVFRSLAEIGPDARPAAVAVGNFDGVHTGHRRLFRRVVKASIENGWIPSVLTFDPHPTRVVAPDRAAQLLTTAEERWPMMREEGIQQVIVLPFDREFASLSPEEFARKILVAGVGAAAVYVGDNFRFGSRQAGDVRLLKQLGDQLGFLVEVVPSVYVRGRMASSTEVRNLLLKRPGLLSLPTARAALLDSGQHRDRIRHRIEADRTDPESRYRRRNAAGRWRLHHPHHGPERRTSMAVDQQYRNASDLRRVEAYDRDVPTLPLRWRHTQVAFAWSS